MLPTNVFPKTAIALQVSKQMRSPKNTDFTILSQQIIKSSEPMITEMNFHAITNFLIYTS